jgi:acetylornithine/succinyldiaminopimelate/putrescine aminotransferase
LIPGIKHVHHNQFESLDAIDEHTACVIAEVIQAERGVMSPSIAWMKALRQRCTETGALLVLDEIQTGFGRTGSMFAFEQFDVVPDILLLGKALGGGMPLGAFVASKQMMDHFTLNPVLGHITTFGGHPVCCAAGLAALEFLVDEKLISQVKKNELLFAELLHHPMIKAFRSAGLLMAIDFGSWDLNKKIIDRCIAKGVFTDWFLFASHCMRLAPPLIITEEEIRTACGIILACCDDEQASC